MKIIKKIDDIGRVVIPRDVRNNLRWMGGDEIEIIVNDDDTITLRRAEDNTINLLKTISATWPEDAEVQNHVNALIAHFEK